MKTKAALFTAVLVLAGVTLFAPIYMNYLKIDGVAGDSKAPGYQGWLDASSIDFPSAGAVTNTVGGHAGAQCEVHEIVITKVLDPASAKLAASPKLSKFCASGKHFPAVTVAIRGERHLLQDVVVKSVQDTQLGDGSVREVMTLNFARCATHESAPAALAVGKIVAPDLKLKQTLQPNAILIGLTPKPESAALIGLLFNGDGHSATLTRKAGSPQGGFEQASRSRQTLPTLTITLNNGQKWTFSNVTVGGFTGGLKPGTESVSLNFTKVEGPLSGFQDLSYKE